MSRNKSRALLVEVLCLECRKPVVHQSVPLHARAEIEAAMMTPPVAACPRHPRATHLQRVEEVAS